VQELQQRWAILKDASIIYTELLATGLGLGTGQPRIEESRAKMFGAHMTIGEYAANRGMDILKQEIVVAQKELDLTLATTPLLGPNGEPIRHA
jgi:methanogenic corrinoid protein MtbC1